MDLWRPAPSTQEGRAAEIITVEENTSLDNYKAFYIRNMTHADPWPISLHQQVIISEFTVCSAVSTKDMNG